jgi:hypothetical protein
MTKLILKFKVRSYLHTQLKVSALVDKFALAVEEIFETPGRPDPILNIILRINPMKFAEVHLALKRIPELRVTEKF